tara:strand:+ start:294 stop:446 length:153 start_codon:yes stop_codon:yes gene_type:complete
MDLDEYIEMRIEETKILMDPIHKSINDWENLLRNAEIELKAIKLLRGSLK